MSEDLTEDWQEARRKRTQLESEINQVSDETLRSNLQHTLSKLWMAVDSSFDSLSRVQTKQTKQKPEGLLQSVLKDVAVHYLAARKKKMVVQFALAKAQTLEEKKNALMALDLLWDSVRCIALSIPGASHEIQQQLVAEAKKELKG